MDNSVLRFEEALETMTRSRLRWLLRSGRWQRVHPCVLVTHSGPLTRDERLLAAVKHGGPRAALARETAAALDGLQGFECELIHLVVPRGVTVLPRPGLRITHSRRLDDVDIHPAREPRRTRLPRSVIDIARARDVPVNRARAVIAAAVQQRLTRPADLLAVLDRLTPALRAGLIRRTVEEVVGGAHSLPELEFARLVRRAGLPVPQRQQVRTGAGGRYYLDAEWPEWRLAVEVDGVQHTRATTWWDDLARQNEIVLDGTRLLRFPSWVVRERPKDVAAVIRHALDRAGWSGTATSARAGRG